MDTTFFLSFFQAIAPLVAVIAAIAGLWRHLRARIETDRTEVLKLQSSVSSQQQVCATRHESLQRRVEQLEKATSEIPRLITLVERLDRTMRDLSSGVGRIDRRMGDVSERLARIEGEWHARRDH
jgi:chromosome segregation ATPase